MFEFLQVRCNAVTLAVGLCIEEMPARGKISFSIDHTSEGGRLGRFDFVTHLAQVIRSHI
jgi:hypothetical protein